MHLPSFVFETRIPPGLPIFRLRHVPPHTNSYNITIEASAMSTDFDPLVTFGPDHAATYDDRFKALHGIKDMIHLALESTFANLPETAHLLIAGAGTGAEVRHLAPLFPNWRFTLVDPASAMLEIAKRHAEAEGFADRCTFHATYVSEVDAGNFDAATSLLVSHFVQQADARTDYFRSIADRLKPGAPMLNADLCADQSGAEFETLMKFWQGMMAKAGMTPEGQEQYAKSFGTIFACHGPSDVEAMIETAGFIPPVQCVQAGLIKGWLTAKA